MWNRRRFLTGRIVERRPAEGYAVSEDRGLIVAVDAEVTPELEREGLARDLIRHIQQRRKELDLEVTDRIAVGYDTGAEKLLRAIDEHRERIAAETLARQLSRGAGGEEITLLGETVRRLPPLARVFSDYGIRLCRR